MKPLLALDFDGVICDSLSECLVSAVNASASLRGQDTLISSPNSVDSDLAARFRRHRHLVRPAGEYETLLHWLQTREEAPEPAKFAALARRRAAEVLTFQPIFFAVRARLRAEDSTAWTALHRQYRQGALGWDELRARYEIHLVTTKDLPSVRHFNKRWRLGLADDHLHTCERFTSKPAAVAGMAAARGCAPSEITFVDDHPGHLADVAATGARCLWAAWGYAGDGGDWRRLENLSDLLETAAPTNAKGICA